MGLIGRAAYHRFCYAAAVHFGAWHPITEAQTAAPDAAGVIQMRAEGVMDYRAGRSAMVMYAAAGPEETLRRFVAGRGARDVQRAVAAGARWIRFAEAADAAAQLDRLLKTFVERFGSLPIANAGSARRSLEDE
jgi:hypothetical protein